jgi:hypothetical protein
MQIDDNGEIAIAEDVLPGSVTAIAEIVVRKIGGNIQISIDLMYLAICSYCILLHHPSPLIIAICSKTTFVPPTRWFNSMAGADLQV